MKLAAQDNADRASEPIRKLDLGTGQTEQRQALSLLREKIHGVVAKDVRRAAPLQQADETQREFLLDGVQMGKKNPAVDLVDVHGDNLTANYITITSDCLCREDAP
jgi:hypothetical protein